MAKININSIPAGKDGQGYITLNGRVLPAFIVTKIDANTESIKETRRFLGERTEQNAIRGIRIAGNISYNHTTSALMQAIRDYKNGADYPEITIQYYTGTTERGRSEAILTGVIIDTIGFGALDEDNDNSITTDSAFTANDFDIISTFEED